MRLTNSGWALLALAAALVVVGRFFGTLELFLLAGIALTTVVLAALVTATRRLELAVNRQASPAQLRAGAPARIDLTLRNRGRRATPVLRLHDNVAGHGGARLQLAPIPGGGQSSLSYRLPTQRRGPLAIGPLELEFGDPLGLTSSRVEASSQAELLVHPRLVELSPLRAGSGASSGVDHHAARSLAPAGDEFYALRPYVVGDELKRVHWRNSARLDDLVVRQEERPRQGQVVVILDVRSESYDEAGFERAVSAAASALHAAWAGGDAVRFLTSNATDSGPLTHRGQLDAVEERLARVVRTPVASLARTIENAARSATGGSLVVVTGHGGDDMSGATARVRRTFGAVVVIVCQHHGDAGAGVIVHDGRADLAQQWDQHLHRHVGGGRNRRLVRR